MFTRLNQTILHHKKLTCTSSFVKIVEVGPRDGLQNEKTFIPTEIKVDLINRLSLTGLTCIETTSFVSPKWVPQMADASQVFSQIKHHSHITYPCLVPNEKGFILANYLKVKEVAVFVSATDAFSQKNTHQTVQASLVQARRVCDLARLESVRVRAYVSCVFECPYSGKVDPQKVALIAKEMVEMGCYEVSLGDTIGKGTPGQMRSLIEALKGNVSVDRIAVHCHDTYGMALANVLSALDKGVRVVDASVAGLGGCPYAEGSTGNLATEDLVYMLNGLGYKHGVDLSKLVKVGNFISEYLKKENGSKVAKALTNKL